jgi:hypothetical protein
VLEAAVERFGAGPGEPDIEALIALDADVRATYGTAQPGSAG